MLQGDTDHPSIQWKDSHRLSLALNQAHQDARAHIQDLSQRDRKHTPTNYDFKIKESPVCIC